jgi:hypothetical protein
MKRIYRLYSGIALLAISFISSSVISQVPTDLYSGLKWRNIGPYHGGRISAVSGAVGEGQYGVFYAGAPIGGLWKTTSGGVTWFQIFDQFQNVDSIGAVQVAPSNPDIVYVGTGDSVGGPSGDGMYKSTDAGRSFVHIGLDETTKINKIVINPKNPDIVVVSTQGDATHNGRGIYRTTDGGKTWENTLRPDNANGTRDVEYAFDMPNVIFAASQGAAADLAAELRRDRMEQLSTNRLTKARRGQRFPRCRHTRAASASPSRRTLTVSVSMSSATRLSPRDILASTALTIKVRLGHIWPSATLGSEMARAVTAQASGLTHKTRTLFTLLPLT